VIPPLAAGPPALSAVERDRIRYGLIDLLDDLHHAVDPGERTAIAAAAWISAAEKALTLADHGVGGGKWLLRALHDLDEDLARRWLDAHGDIAAIMALGHEVLDRHGGPLFDGYRLAGSRPI
jgi:hypothetical protein